MAIATQRRLDAVQASRGAPSARNLLVTVFGDAIAPHDVAAAVSVASLADLLAPFGVSERLVRTSLSRLVAESLLQVRSVGRRSFYGIDSSATELFAEAEQRIYHRAAPTWDGYWTLVIIDGAEGSTTERAQRRQALIDDGFSPVAPNVLASAHVSPATVSDAIGADDRGSVLVTRSATVEVSGHSDPDRAMAARVYDIDDVAANYHDFLVTFADFGSAEVSRLSPREAFKLRVWAVAAFRRIVLNEHPLPPELLPSPWVGDEARRLVGAIYRGCVAASQRFVVDTVTTDRGALADQRASARLGSDLMTRFD